MHSPAQHIPKGINDKSTHSINPSSMAVSHQPTQVPRYRPAKQITDEMRMHCHIYLDEQLYSSALTLLSDIVTAGASHPDCLEQPVFSPLPFHLELISTLLIHPSYTNQASPQEAPELASRSIAFLRNVLYILGPLNANLKEAFCLTTSGVSKSSRRKNTEGGTSGSDSEETTEPMKGILANRGRLRRCAKDFWHVVGWAFNCSANYPSRWRYWKIWLEYILDVLDADWSERERLEELRRDGLNLRRDSLLAAYVSGVNGRSNAVRRIVRSIFADGEADSLRDFPEVFPNESSDIKIKGGTKRKRDGPQSSEFNSYDSDEVEDDINRPNTIEQRPYSLETPNDQGTPFVVDPWFGGTDTAPLRQGILALLSRIAFYLPESFVPCQDLYEIIYDCVKPLPVVAFCSLFSSSKSTKFPDAVSISLSQFLLDRLLPTTAPRPFDISGQYDDDLSQDILEKCFLPFPAMTSSISDNTKVSILVEGLFRLFARNCVCYITPTLKAVTEHGILERESKIKGNRRRKDARSRDLHQEDIWLRASSERLRSLLCWLEQMSEDDFEIPP